MIDEFMNDERKHIKKEKKKKKATYMKGKKNMRP
jgi:hypothetical protein